MQLRDSATVVGIHQGSVSGQSWALPITYQEPDPARAVYLADICDNEHARFDVGARTQSHPTFSKYDLAPSTVHFNFGLGFEKSLRGGYGPTIQKYSQAAVLLRFRGFVEELETGNDYTDSSTVSFGWYMEFGISNSVRTFRVDGKDKVLTVSGLPFAGTGVFVRFLKGRRLSPTVTVGARLLVQLELFRDDNGAAGSGEVAYPSFPVALLLRFNDPYTSRFLPFLEGSFAVQRLQPLNYTQTSSDSLSRERGYWAFVPGLSAGWEF